MVSKRALKKRDEIVLKNQGLVHHIARPFARGGRSLDDLIQEGNLGLLRAIELFDPHKGVRFSTYASLWIRAFVMRSVKTAPVVHLGLNTRSTQGQRGPEVLSLDAPMTDRDSSSFVEALESNEESVAASMERRELDIRVREVIARLRLKAMQRAIINQRLMRGGRVDGATLEEVALGHDRTRESVRKVELRLVEKLRRVLAPIIEEAA